ncbi:MAG TPA: tRNA 5'-guanylyltransferase [Methanotrichaceae archaeon]|nr:tRNA 5'-guanylyltransferase [Methanotrichaceae archaeon]
MTRRANSREIYADLRVRAPLVVRADGRGFGKILKEAKKPYDLDFARVMAKAARGFFEESGLGPALAFTFSDEINLLFLKTPFNGRLEKIDSVVAGSLSGLLALGISKAVAMDARAIPLCPEEVGEYFAERQDEAWRNHVFSYGFYALIEDGQTPNQAMGSLQGMKEGEIHEMLFQRGVNLAKNPAWQRRGILIRREMDEYGKGIVEDWEPPLFRSEEGRSLLERTIREL